MNETEIVKIQAYKGDSIEELWKPTPSTTDPYIDWFYYWEFRETIAAGNLATLRPSKPGNIVSKKALYQHERLAGYYYSAYVRLAAMHKCLNELKGMYRGNDPNVFMPSEPDILETIFRFEGFYHFFGSVLDMLAGAGNIIYGFRQKEDSFSNFKKSFEALNSCNPLEKQALDKLSEVDRSKDYRDHIVHRPTFAMWAVLDRRKDAQVALDRDIRIEKDYRLMGPQGTKMWRAILRGMLKGYIESVSIIDLCDEHLRQVESAGNLLFHCLVDRLPEYLTRNNIRMVPDRMSELVDPTTPPADAKFVFYLCPNCEQKQLLLSVWLQKLDDLSGKCDLCGQPNIVPLFLVSE